MKCKNCNTAVGIKDGQAFHYEGFLIACDFNKYE